MLPLPSCSATAIIFVAPHHPSSCPDHHKFLPFLLYSRRHRLFPPSLPPPPSLSHPYRPSSCTDHRRFLPLLLRSHRCRLFPSAATAGSSPLLRCGHRRFLPLLLHSHSRCGQGMLAPSRRSCDGCRTSRVFDCELDPLLEGWRDRNLDREGAGPYSQALRRFQTPLAAGRWHVQGSRDGGWAGVEGDTGAWGCTERRRWHRGRSSERQGRGGRGRQKEEENACRSGVGGSVAKDEEEEWGGEWWRWLWGAARRRRGCSHVGGGGGGD